MSTNAVEMNDFSNTNVDPKPKKEGKDDSGREVSELPVGVKAGTAKFLARLFTGYTKTSADIRKEGGPLARFFTSNLIKRNSCGYSGKQTYADQRNERKAPQNEEEWKFVNGEQNLGANQEIVRVDSQLIPNSESKGPSVLSKVGSAVKGFFAEEGTLHSMLKACPPKRKEKKISEMLDEIRTKTGSTKTVKEEEKTAPAASKAPKKLKVAHLLDTPGPSSLLTLENTESKPKKTSVLSRIGSPVNDFFKKNGTLHSMLKACPPKRKEKKISEMLDEMRTKTGRTKTVKEEEKTAPAASKAPKKLKVAHLLGTPGPSSLLTLENTESKPKKTSVPSRIGSAVNDFFKKNGTLHGMLMASPPPRKGKPISKKLQATSSDGKQKFSTFQEDVLKVRKKSNNVQTTNKLSKNKDGKFEVAHLLENRKPKSSPQSINEGSIPLKSPSLLDRLVARFIPIIF